MKKNILISVLVGIIVTILVYRPTVDDRSNDWLYEVADRKLQDLLITDYWSHDLSDGCNFLCRVEPYREEGKYTWAGENLWRGAKGEGCNLVSAIERWKLSPTHNYNLEHEYTREVVLTGSNQDYCYIVQVRSLN